MVNGKDISTFVSLSPCHLKHMPHFKAVLDPKRSQEAPKASQRPFMPLVVKNGILPLFPCETGSISSPIAASDHVSAASSCQQGTLDFMLSCVSKKRTIQPLPEEAQQLHKKRKLQTCKKCGNSECKGRKEVKLCFNKCKDCGKAGYAFEGHDSKRPHLPCNQNEENE